MNHPYTLEIRQDEEPYSPREDDNFGTMVCWHRRYTLGDEHEFATPDDFREWWRNHGKRGILFSLYMYDHSGITISTTPFACHWDSGPIGYIYATEDDIKREFGGSRLRAAACMNAEVETYDKYVRGDIWEYVVYKNDEYVSSVGGYYDEEEARKAGEAEMLTLDDPRAIRMAAEYLVTVAVPAESHGDACRYVAEQFGNGNMDIDITQVVKREEVIDPRKT